MLMIALGCKAVHTPFRLNTYRIDIPWYRCGYSFLKSLQNKCNFRCVSTERFEGHKLLPMFSLIRLEQLLSLVRSHLDGLTRHVI